MKKKQTQTVKVVGSGGFIDSGQFGVSTGGCPCNEQFDQFVLDRLIEATSLMGML
ncbi:Uncharacterised protein [Helicobacter pametensis]|nr:Uncharacterised protein [Helicobacter pametensis]